MNSEAKVAAKDKAAEKMKIFVNNNPVRVNERATGSEIKLAAGLPAEFKLYDEKGREVADDKRIKVEKGDRFTAISGQDVS